MPADLHWWLQAGHHVPVSFFSISEVYPPKLKTEEKRLHLTLEAVDLYNRAIQDAGLLVPEGALYLVDLHHLTQGKPLLPLRCVLLLDACTVI